MHTLTKAQSDLINKTPHTHDYSADADTVSEEDLTLRFEAEIEGMYDGGDDIGGVCIYMKRDGTLVAFYDYENFCGTVFAQ